MNIFEVLLLKFILSLLFFLTFVSTDILVLDDPLSALDMHVADNIMKDGICGELKTKTRIIVTNAIQHLKYADTIYIVDNGRLVFNGSFEQIQHNDIYQELLKTTEVKITKNNRLINS